MKRTTWAVIIAACVSMAIQASPVDPTRAPRQARYDQTDEYDKYVVENGLKGDVNNDIRDLVELFGGLKTADDVDRNAYGNDRPPYPNRPPLPPRPGNVQNYNQMSERIMNSLYNSFGGPAIRSMIEQYTRSGYSGGGGGGGGAGYGEEECCKYDAYTIIPGFVLVAVSYLLLLLLNATVTGGRRRREADDAQLNRIDDDVMLDGPTWLSMVHELWEQDDSSENMACIQETLCRMNRLAMGAPGQAGWAVSLSSLPLSYLLHARHTGGFTSYIDAALMGRSGANCTELYSSCPRLHY